MEVVEMVTVARALVRAVASAPATHVLAVAATHSAVVEEEVGRTGLDSRIADIRSDSLRIATSDNDRNATVGAAGVRKRAAQRLG
jgi:hypothetical protein